MKKIMQEKNYGQQKLPVQRPRDSSVPGIMKRLKGLKQMNLESQEGRQLSCGTGEI